jgi:hypothetical protein
MTEAAPETRPAPRSGGGKSLGSSPVLALGAIAFGGYLLWFGVKYWRGTGDNVWPSTPIKAVLQGKSLPPNTAAATADVQVTSYEQSLVAASASSASSGGGTGTGPQPSGSAQNIAKLLLTKYGWGLDQLPPLITLWTQESGWDALIANPSGAFGIAQALGHGGPDTAAQNVHYTVSQGVGPKVGTVNEYGAEYGLSVTDAQQANAGNKLQQIRWGLGYIKAAYGSPAAAESHEARFGWY